MPRRTAAERHLDSGPAPAPDPSSELADLLVAYHHPIRRWLSELLALEGPANVGQLAARTELAVGSVSHHLKALHRQGLVERKPGMREADVALQEIIEGKIKPEFTADLV